MKLSDKIMKAVEEEYGTEDYYTDLFRQWYADAIWLEDAVENEGMFADPDRDR